MFVPILQLDRLWPGAQKRLRKNLVNRVSLKKVEWSRSRSPDPAGGGGGVGELFCALCTLPSARARLGSALQPRRLPRPGVLHLGPWNSPKQEPREELLVFSQFHLVCIPPAQPQAVRFLGWGAGQSSSLCSSS